MELCSQDSVCNAHFEATNLSTTVQNLITKLDNNPNSTCAALFSNSTDTSPSVVLRATLGTLLSALTTRAFIPPLVYRLNRCDSNDVNVLNQFFIGMTAMSTMTNQDDAYESTLLYYLIIFSDMWETPAPSMVEMEMRFKSARIADGGIYAVSSLYCVFSKEMSPSCDELNIGNYEGDGIIYQRDQYWNKSATVSSESSVLLLNGKLDPQTPYKYAEYLLDALDCSKKELVTFDYTTHGTIMSTPFDDGNGTSRNCGMELLVSYVSNDGDLQHLNRSCVDEMPAFNLTVPVDFLNGLFSTDEAYDGVYNASLSQTEESG